MLGLPFIFLHSIGIEAACVDWFRLTEKGDVGMEDIRFHVLLTLYYTKIGIALVRLIIYDTTRNCNVESEVEKDVEMNFIFFFVLHVCHILWNTRLKSQERGNGRWPDICSKERKDLRVMGIKHSFISSRQLREVQQQGKPILFLHTLYPTCMCHSIIPSIVCLKCQINK